MKDIAEKIKNIKIFNWPGPLANLLAQDFKNVSSFETLGPFRLFSVLYRHLPEVL